MDIQDKNTISKQDEKWVEKQQRNSWNPEIIISGISLAFILAFPHSIYNFVVFMIQEWGMSFLGGLLILTYLLMLVNVFKVFLILHLALRFAWAGFLGISYAFPSGVKKDKLFEYQKLDNYMNPKQMVIKLERICSMAFGIPLNMALIFIPLSIYLFILIGIHIIFKLEFFYLYILFMASMLLFFLFVILAKKLKLKLSGNNYLATIGALYSSNIGKWKYNLVIISLFIFTIPFIKIDSKNIFQYFNITNLQEDILKWPNDDWYYSDTRNTEKRFSRVLLASYETEFNILPITIAHYDEDYGFLSQLKNNFPKTLDTLNWGQTKEIKDLYKVYINDSLVITQYWQPFLMPKTDQKAYRTAVDISHLHEGVHQIRVEKLVVSMAFMFKAGEPKLRKEWSVVKFHKRHPNSSQ